MRADEDKADWTFSEQRRRLLSKAVSTRQCISFSRSALREPVHELNTSILYTEIIFVLRRVVQRMDSDRWVCWSTGNPDRDTNIRVQAACSSLYSCISCCKSGGTTEYTSYQFTPAPNPAPDAQLSTLSDIATEQRRTYSTNRKPKDGRV